MAQVHGVHGMETVETFLVNIYLPNKVAITNARVTLGQQLPDADILIGMDVICRGDFAVTNAGGITKFSYRNPSIEHIDYTAEAAALREANSQPQNRAARRRAKFGR